MAYGENAPSFDTLMFSICYVNEQLVINRSFFDHKKYKSIMFYNSAKLQI